MTQIDGVWSQVSDGLEHACRKTGGDLTADYLWSQCRSGAAFLVVVTRENQIIAASVWSFQKWTSGRKLKCLAAYGTDMTAWLTQHRQMIVELARAGGATAIVAEGRPGWARVFPEARILRQTYEMEL